MKMFKNIFRYLLVIIEETHRQDEIQARVEAKNPDYDIIGITYHHIYGILTYSRNDIENVKLISSSSDIHKKNM